MSKLTVTALVPLFLAVACEDRPESLKLCLEGDLGRYQLEKIEAISAGYGCRALYRDPAGKLARVTVTRDRPFSGDAGVPYPFEKQFVLYRPEKKAVSMSWHSGPVVVEVWLQDLAVPQGPVLRAYLFEYHSGVTADVETLHQEVDQLKDHQRSRPKDAELHLDLARKYRRLGDNIMATQELHIAISADRGCYPCYLEMGSLYFELRHWDLCIRALRRAAAIRPDDPVPQLKLGDVFFKVRNGLEARGAYEKALTLGLAGEEKQRAEKRLAELKKGKYMIEVLPGARKPKSAP